MNHVSRVEMTKKWKSLLAIGIGIIPFNVMMVWYRLTHEAGFTFTEMLVYPLIFGTGSILLILALNRYLLKQKINVFNPGKGTWYWDILNGLGLTAIYFLLVFIEQRTITRFLPPGKPPSKEVIDLMAGLVNNPLLLVIWLGPVAWVGVAAFEEIQRIFFMNCLWQLSKNRFWELFPVILVAVVWGFMHLYQGAFGIISISIQGMVMGFFYYRYRRIWPLIISHALYNSIQILIFVVQVNG